MKKLIGACVALLSMSLLLAQPAMAQQVTAGRVSTAAPTYVNGETRPISLDTAGNLRTTAGGGSASGTAATGNPVPIGCTYLTTPPTLTNGQRQECLMGTRGSLNITIMGENTGNSPAIGGPIADTSSNVALYTIGYGFVYNGSSWDRARAIGGAATTGIGTTSVAISPHTVATGAIVPVATSAVGGSLIAKASAGNLYDWQVTAGASAGYVLVFNNTTVPADGAVTPLQCVAVAANATVGSSSHNIPDRFTTGITIVFSTTGCFTKTISATAFIRARAV